MSSGWRSQPALTRVTRNLPALGSVAWVLGSDFTKPLEWYVPPSIIATRRFRSRFPWEPGPPHLADPAVDLADAVQGRGRSSSIELRTLDSIDARFQFLKTRFRVVILLFTCQRASGAFRPLTHSLREGWNASDFDIL
jgi:hypothetical protein